MAMLWDWFTGTQQPAGYRDDRGTPYNNGYGAAAKPDFWQTLGNVNWNDVSGAVGDFQGAQKQPQGQQPEEDAGEMFQHKPQKRPYKWLKFKGLLDG